VKGVIPRETLNIYLSTVIPSAVTLKATDDIIEKLRQLFPHSW